MQLVSGFVFFLIVLFYLIPMWDEWEYFPEIACRHKSMDGLWG